MSLTIHVPGELEKALAGAAAMHGVPAEEYAISTLEEHVMAEEQPLPDDESGLLLEINRGFSMDWWSRYKQLVNKKQNHCLSSEELAELIRRTDALEAYGARRLQCLAKLAEMRQTSVDQLMDQLEIRPFELED
jgi:hypothetical protein